MYIFVFSFSYDFSSIFILTPLSILSSFLSQSELPIFLHIFMLSFPPAYVPVSYFPPLYLFPFIFFNSGFLQDYYALFFLLLLLRFVHFSSHCREINVHLLPFLSFLSSRYPLPVTLHRNGHSLITILVLFVFVSPIFRRAAGIWTFSYCHSCSCLHVRHFTHDPWR